MPEAPAWRFEKIIKPMFDIPLPHRVLTGGRVLTCRGDEVIDNGYVEIKDGVIIAVGPMSELGDTVAEVTDCSGKTIMPGMINSHAHLAWDGVHDLARQSLDDAPEISAYKCAGNMLKSLRAGITLVRDLGMNRSNFFAKQAVEQGIFPVRVCLSSARPSSRPAAIPIGAAAKRAVLTRCGGRCAIRSRAAPI